MKKLLTIVLFFINGLIFSQDQITFNSSNDGTTFVTCNGFIIDSGGQGGSGYSNNEDITITICPDTIGSGNNDDYITVIFNLFDLDTYDDNPAANAENLDYMYVYDGPSTASNSLGVYSGDDLESTTIQATNLNPSGCITLRFVSNSQNNTGTWQYTASATCATPCDPPVAAGEIVGGPTTDSIAVCVGDLVTFQENGSYAQASFNLVDYEWDFMDGNSATTTQGGIVQHAFSEPGEYQINLFVTDDNSDEVCQNNNLTDLRVYVATPPTFYEFPSDTTLCIGESVDLVAQPEIFDSTWAGFQGVTQIDDGCLYDDLLGVAQVVDLMQTGFTAGETIDDISDIESICLEMEHSYMGDLVIQVQCPNGQMITLHQQGGGGTQIGVPDQADDVNCDDGTGLGTPYIYCFTPSATETWVEWVTNNGWGQTLPAGDYESVDPLNGLIGCPLNGVWNLIVTDNWGADDGTVFGFGLNFESSLYPDVTEFTPQVGDNADSSFWDNSGAFITYTSADANTITVTPTTSGTYTYNYTVYDDFGCVNDSSLTITVDEQYVADAGLDQAICVGEIATLGPPTPQCSQDGGNYTYCYGNNENGTTWTFCPDTPGDGLTFMTVTFNSGNIETGWDELYVYDGNSTSGTQIGGLIDGDLSGLSFTATNFTGCITMEFYSDGSVSCASSSNYTEWDFDVSCGGGPSVVYDWSPSATLDDATAANPDASPTTTTNYTLSIYPTGHPDCVTTDDVNVTVSIPGDAGTDSTAVLCIEGAVVDLFNYLGGTPDTGGTWYDPNGVEVSMPALPDTLMDGMYEYVIGGGSCQTSARIDVSIKELTLTANVTGSACNAFSGEVQLIPAGYTGDVEYSNDNGVNFQTSDTFTGMGGGNSYDFLAQDSLGCQATITEVVDDVDFPIIDATSVQLTDSDCGQDNGEVVTATTTGGTSPYQYYVDGQSTTQDLPIQNLSVSDPNTFDLIVVDANGCEDTTEITISEINQPLITDVVSTNVSCNSQADGQIEIIGNNLASYSIDNGVTFQNGTAIFTNLAPGTYQIMAASGEDGMYCQDSWSAVVEITEPDPLQISSITPDITVCPGDEVSLSVQGTGGNGNYTFDWSTSAQGEDIVVSPQQSMQVCVTMSEDCPSPTDEACVNITTSQAIFPTMTTDVIEGCFPVEVTFQNTTISSEIATVTWTVEGNEELVSAGNNGIVYSYQTPGVYDVSMLVESIYGCFYDTTFYQYITVYDYPEANFSYTPAPLTVYETEAQFTDYSEGDVVMWSWDFGSGVVPSTSVEQHPSAIYPEGVAGFYPVTLTVMDENGCVDSLTSQVQVINDVILYAPNVFTPDGDDYNETWRVYISGVDIYDFHLTIFNRWGETVFESYNPDGEWDGTYGGNGPEVQDGTYVWVIYANDSYNDKKYQFRGTVTILK